MHFMTTDTSVFGLAIHNWMIALAITVVIWAAVIVRDL